METVEKFAETHRLHIRRDECGDKIIPGKRGHLYFDHGSLCMMAIDRKVAKRPTWESVGGRLWLGDISLNDRGMRVQDVKIEGIPNEKAAIRMAGVKTIRVLSDAQRAVLESMQASRQSITSVQDQSDDQD